LEFKFFKEAFGIEGLILVTQLLVLVVKVFVMLGHLVDLDGVGFLVRFDLFQVRFLQVGKLFLLDTLQVFLESLHRGTLF